MLSALAAFLLLAAAVGALGGISAESSSADANKEKFNTQIEEFESKYGKLSETELEALKDKYYDAYDPFDSSTWFNRGDYKDGAQDFLDRLSTALNELPPMPEMYTSAELQDIYNKAAGEIDAETSSIQNIYDSILNRQTEAYQNELDASNDAYNAYSNQVLANQLQSQNAMQGAYRAELDRAQRNAITRGASAATRLVANINANLGMQNQSAQQALETSNTLAQALLNQRQAAAGLRQQYSSDLNSHAAQSADLRRGATERRHAYGTEKQNYAQYLRETDYNNWDRRITDEYSDDPVLEGMLRRRASQRSRSSTNSTI
jgi:hypothetical protein